MSNCPKCKQDTVIKVNGDGWDWDREWCCARDCDYDIELDTMTCHEPDGSTYTMEQQYEVADKIYQDYRLNS